MKTESHSINDVLAKNATSFFIPPFQRSYAWGRPEIERYISDVARIIESHRDSGQRDKLEHFFGTIVIKEEQSGFASKSVIVDGQQRLTTTLIFLIALRDTETELTNKDFITNNYLKNNTSSFQDKIKLKQVTTDWDAYKALVNNDNPIPGVITDAYELMKKLIIERKRRNPDVTFEHYIIALNRMNVAVIFLDERKYKGEDPQIIFETLNSLGKPLTLSDLIRNYILLNLDSNRQTAIYEEIWHPKIEKELNEYTSKFFRDYLQFKTASPLKVVSDNNTKALYQEFKEYVKNTFISHEDLIEDIEKHVKCYKWIVYEENPDLISFDVNKDLAIKELLRNIFHDIKTEAFKPFVLGLLFYNKHSVNGVGLANDELISTLLTIRTYLIRRRVLGIGKGENKSIPVFIKKIEAIALGNSTMIELLTNSFFRMRMPNDHEMMTNLKTMAFYNDVKQYSKFILAKMEEHKSGDNMNFRNPKITIEHIMPQELNQDWKRQLGGNFEEIHKKYLHNIGNLILTEFSQEMGNKSFEEKKRRLITSSLSYSSDIIKNELWNESSIVQHQENMIQWFIETFPLPAQYRNSENYNSHILEDISFSPLDGDAADLAEGNKPTEMNIFGNIHHVNTWQEVFIKFLLFIKDSKQYDLEYVIQNQYELFNRQEVIIKWSALKEIIDTNINLTSRYKTFEGTVWEKVKVLQDDLLFIHTNISASTCVARIATVMERLYIPDNAIMISIK